MLGPGEEGSSGLEAPGAEGGATPPAQRAMTSPRAASPSAWVLERAAASAEPELSAAGWERLMVPADGWCLLHAVLAADQFERQGSNTLAFASQWRAKHRPDSGYAHDEEQRADEEDAILALWEGAADVMRAERERPTTSHSLADSLVESLRRSSWGNLELPYVLAALPNPRISLLLLSRSWASDS